MYNYWLKKEALSEHAIAVTKQRGIEYGEEIEKSIRKTSLFTDENISKYNKSKTQSEKIPEFVLYQADSVSTIFNKTTDFERVAVLNFASYKHPGGMFIEGSSAQEESLCHASTLYNVLSEFKEYYEQNNKNKNRGLYYNRALYSEDIIFFDNNGDSRLVDVLTCAAPNAGCFLRYNYGEGAKALNNHILADRIVFMRDIFDIMVDLVGLETVILGAWGCGVFKQDPNVVAKYMISTFSTTKLKRVIFGVPDDSTHKVFENIFIDIVQP